MKETQLTKQDRDFIAQIVCDEDTGNYLLRKRDEDYIGYRHDLYLLLTQSNTDKLSDIDIEKCDFYWACKDPEIMKMYNEKYNSEVK